MEKRPGRCPGSDRDRSALGTARGVFHAGLTKPAILLTWTVSRENMTEVLHDYLVDLRWIGSQRISWRSFFAGWIANRDDMREAVAGSHQSQCAHWRTVPDTHSSSGAWQRPGLQLASAGQGAPFSNQQPAHRRAAYLVSNKFIENIWGYFSSMNDLITTPGQYFIYKTVSFFSFWCVMAVVVQFNYNVWN